MSEFIQEADPKKLLEKSVAQPILASTRRSTKNLPSTAIWQIQFDQNTVDIQTFSPKDFTPMLHDVGTQWLHFVGIHDALTLERLLAPFHIHALVIEDILHTKQLPKLEQYHEYLFFVGQALSYQGQDLITDQVYIILGKNFVLSFQNHPLGIFSQIRERLLIDHIPLRTKGADFLAYTLLDCLVDDYFTILGQFEAKVENVDKVLFDMQQEGVLQKIHGLKHETTHFRRALMPLSENLKQIVRGDFSVFSEETCLFTRDVYDHAIHLLESLNSARGMVSSMTDSYLSFQSNRMNIQIRLLTVITIMLLPLTLITGIYGMNFKNMPELHWEHGYYYILGVMALISGTLCWIFYKKQWL